MLFYCGGRCWGVVTRPAELRCCGATAWQLLACHVVSPRAARPGVAASECDLVEGGLRAYVIAYTTTQRLGVVVQLHANLCAFVPANSGSLPLVGCYQCAASGKAGGCSSSFGVRAGAQRAGPSSCAGFFLLANRQLLCDRYARVGRCAFVPTNRGIYRCFGVRYPLWVVMCGEGQITCGVYAPWFGNAGDRDCNRHSLTGLPGPCLGRFIRPMKDY